MSTAVFDYRAQMARTYESLALAAYGDNVQVRPARRKGFVVTTKRQVGTSTEFVTETGMEMMLRALARTVTPRRRFNP